MFRAIPVFKGKIFAMLVASGFLCACVGAMGAGEKIIDAGKAGLVGDGVTLNTGGIQKLIDECAGGGGGTIDFPAGRYLTGTIEIKSHVILRLEEGAILLGSTDAADYRNLDPFVDGSGSPMGFALIVAVNANHVGIEGTGTVDGQGPKLKAKEGTFGIRPFLVRWVRCSDVVVRDIHLTDPGAWTLHFSQTKRAVVEGVTIRTRQTKLLNNDGMDIDSSEDVAVRNCDVDSEDDAIVIKSTAATPSRDIVVNDCKLSSHANAIKLGTESFGGFQDIWISNCEIVKTDMAGIALYDVDGGNMENVTISDISMDGVAAPISIRLGSRLKTFRKDEERKAQAGELSDVAIENVTAKNVKTIGVLINGVEDHPVEGLRLENILMELPGGGTEEAGKVELAEKESAYPEFNMFGKTMPAYGIYARHVRGLKILNVQMSLLKPDARPAEMLMDFEGATSSEGLEAK